MPSDGTRHFIQTARGGKYYYGERNIVSFGEICDQLAKVNRFVGATAQPFSVCQHSINVVKILRGWNCDALTCAYGAAHDGHEFCIGDFTTPFQRWLADVCGYDVLEMAKSMIDSDLMPALGLPWPAQKGIWEVVKRADNTAFVEEASQLFSVLPDWFDERAKNVTRFPMDCRDVPSDWQDASWMLNKLFLDAKREAGITD